MYHGWFRLCLSADGSTATAGEEEAPAPGHLPFWFKPVSAFGLFKFTTFISSSPELAMPSTLVLDRLSASSRRVLSRETRPPGSGEVKRLAENNLSVCGYFSAVFSSQHLSLSSQYFGAGLRGHIV